MIADQKWSSSMSVPDVSNEVLAACGILDGLAERLDQAAREQAARTGENAQHRAQVAAELAVDVRAVRTALVSPRSTRIPATPRPTTRTRCSTTGAVD
jgi:hypothetical protein